MSGVKRVTENSRKQNRDKIIYGILALLLFGILFVLTNDRSEKQERTTASIVMLGDSILGECRDETSIPAILSEMLSEKVFNGGLGGTSMGRLDGERRLAYTKDCLTMQALSQAIVADDFGPQQTVRIREHATQYFEETINELEKIDFESVDILFIGHGVNDYHSGAKIANEEDPYDVYTFIGALRSAVEALQERYPDLRIILLTPTYSWYVYYEDAEQTCENNDFGGGVLEDYVNAEIALAESLGVEVIDFYHDFYPHGQWSDWQLYTNDGLHPNEASRRRIAETIYAYLETNEMR